MKKYISLLLVFLLIFSGCASTVSQGTSSPEIDVVEESTIADACEEKEAENNTISVDIAIEKHDNPQNTTEIDTMNEAEEFAYDDSVEFGSLSDPELLQYVRDNINADLSEAYSSDNFHIENIQTAYVSQEYIDELEYNSKKNIYFGYTLEEIDKQFAGIRYMFTLGDDGITEVKEYEVYDDSYEKVVKNVAIGTGVILTCVTVSIITEGAGAPLVVSVFFSSAAKTGTVYALSSGIISAALQAIITGVQTGDPQKALKEAAVEGSNSFKWGAIVGSITGGISSAISIANGSLIPTPQESELYALQKYPGEDQVSFLNKVKVSKNTPGATRPDIWRPVGDHWEAVEVKNYNLSKKSNVNSLCKELKRQVSQRVKDLPDGSTQRIVLDTRGRIFKKGTTNNAIECIRETLKDVYPDIPIDILK